MLKRLTHTLPVRWRRGAVPRQLRNANIYTHLLLFSCKSVSGQREGCVCAPRRSDDDPLSALGKGQGRSASNAGAVAADIPPAAPGAVGAHAAALRQVLGLPHPAQLMALVERCPALFAFSPEALEATLEAMAGLTGLHFHQVPQLVAADPELLLQPDRLKANMTGLAKVLMVPVHSVLVMAGRAPEVLALSGEVVEGRMRALAASFLAANMYDKLVPAVLYNPGVLLVPEPQAVEERLQALESALLCVLGDVADTDPATAAPTQPPQPQVNPRAPAPASQAQAQAQAQHPPPPQQHPPSHARLQRQPQQHPQQPQQPQRQLQPEEGREEGAATAAAVPPPRPPLVRRLVAPLVLSKPSLLNAPPQLLAGRLVHLARKAQVEPVQVLQTAPSGPNILAVNSCLFDRHCAALAPLIAVPAAATVGGGGGAVAAAAAASDGEADAAAILVAAPALFDQHLTALAAKWNLLVAAMGTHPRWAEWLAAAPLYERAELLNMPYMTLPRLRFLADMGLQSEVQPLEVVRPSDAAFHSQYPEFREWLNR